MATAVTKKDVDPAFQPVREKGPGRKLTTYRTGRKESERKGFSHAGPREGNLIS